jgi:hypothetical protein
MTDTLGGLNGEEFDLIARENPKEYSINTSFKYYLSQQK